jgi:hypothetical protein
VIDEGIASIGVTLYRDGEVGVAEGGGVAGGGDDEQEAFGAGEGEGATKVGDAGVVLRSGFQNVLHLGRCRSQPPLLLG